MKNILLYICFLFAAADAHAQGLDFRWAKGFGSPAHDAAYAVTIDKSGNSYYTGYFSGTVDFDPDPVKTFELVSTGEWDVFILKLDANGRLVWARKTGSALFDYGNAIVVDHHNNVFVGGLFGATTDFDPGTGIHERMCQGASDAFVLKLDQDGNFLWVRQLGGKAGDGVKHMDIDSTGHLYVAGHFSQAAYFEPGSGILDLESTGSADAFVMKLDNAGDLLWARQFGSEGWEFSESVAADNKGNVYYTGIFRDSFILDTGSAILKIRSSGHYDMFIMQLDSAGAYKWIRHIGGPDNQAGRLKLGKTGELYVYANMKNTVYARIGQDTFHISYNDSPGIFMLKLHTSGTFVWAKAIKSSDNVTLSELEVTEQGSLYLAGSLIGNTDFDPASGKHIVSAEKQDEYVARFSSAGELEWVKHLNRYNTNTLYDMAADMSGNIYLTGSFHGFGDYDPGKGVSTLNAIGETDIMTQKLCAWDASIGDPYITDMLLYPNPVSDVLNVFVKQVTNGEDIKVYDHTGRLVLQRQITEQHTEIDMSVFETGLYVVQVKDVVEVIINNE